jgi:hypothetical protein
MFLNSRRKAGFDLGEYPLDFFLAGFEKMGTAKNIHLTDRIKIKKGSCVPFFFRATARDKRDKQNKEEEGNFLIQ